MSDVLAEIESNPQDDEQQFEEPQAEEAQAEYSQAEASQPAPPPAEVMLEKLEFDPELPVTP